MDKQVNSPKEKNKEKFVVALEIGSSKAKIGIAGFNPDSTSSGMTIYRMASLPTLDSVRYGRIYNIREVTDVVSNLVDSLEMKYPIENRRITGVYVGLGGLSMKSRRVSATLVLPERKEITEEMMESLQEKAKSSLPVTEDLICIEPVKFKVDNMTTPRPIGSLGTRFYGEFTAVVCNPANREDLFNVVTERVGLRISGYSVRPLALAHLVLSPQETKVGCMLVDFGAETITVSIYRNYALQYLVTIPLGSRVITRDIATSLALTEEEAEQMKVSKGNALAEKGSGASGDRQDETLQAIITARLADIVANIGAQPRFAKINELALPAGIVLSGGGSMLQNFAELLSVQTGLKVRIATIPADIHIGDPGLSSIDNLDLIALLSEAAADVRAGDDAECLSRERETITEEPVTKEEVAIDFLSDDVKKDLVSHGYEPADFINYEDDTTGGGYQAPDETEDDGLLEDDSQSETEKQKKQRIKAEQRKKQERLKAIERQRRNKEKEKAKPKEPKNSDVTARMNKIIGRLTRFLATAGEDNSADLG